MAAEHIIKSYDEELSRLSKMIVEMGGLAESQLAAAIDAVAKRDSELAAQVVEGDAEVDEIERELDNLAIRLLALRQPMARDLREIFVALKIGERPRTHLRLRGQRRQALDRAGADAADPAGACAAAHGPSGAAPDQGRHRRLCRSTTPTRRSTCGGRDEELDEMYASLFRELLTYMMEDPRNIGA